MPKREDEFWAGMKEGQGRALCPFCGSSNIFYNTTFESWRCNKCEHSFPMPSYGPGGAFGKEARWFGKTTEGERRRQAESRDLTILTKDMIGVPVCNLPSQVYLGDIWTGTIQVPTSIPTDLWDYSGILSLQLRATVFLQDSNGNRARAGGTTANVQLERNISIHIKFNAINMKEGIYDVLVHLDDNFGNHVYENIVSRLYLLTPSQTLPLQKKEAANPKTSIPQAILVKRTSQPTPKAVQRPIQSWLWALLLIFALSVIGLGISIYAGSFIPIWLLLGFSCIYSVEKWFSRTTIKHKEVGKLYRLLLNLCILSLFGLLIWSSIKLFSQELFSSPLFGSLVFLAELVFFIWLWRVVARNSWRFPSMKLTISSLAGIILVLAFAGVHPLSDYKDRALGSISSWFSSVSESTTSTPPSKTSNSVAPSPPVVAPRSNDSSIKVKETIKQTFTVDTSVETYSELFNNYRQENGIQPLVFTEDLNRVASLRLAELKTDFSHNSAGKITTNILLKILPNVIQL